METHFGGNVLIAYASWSGATRQVAEAIAQVFLEAGVTTTVREVAAVTDLQPYTAVVLGSSVHVGKLSQQAVDFAHRFAVELAARPTAWFVVSRIMAEETPAHRKEADGYLDPLRAAAPGITPLIIGHFGGVIQRDTPEYAELANDMEIDPQQTAREPGDQRDWAAIKAWAQTVLPLLAPVKVPA